jgi:hypothetical protein
MIEITRICDSHHHEVSKAIYRGGVAMSDVLTCFV